MRFKSGQGCLLMIKLINMDEELSNINDKLIDLELAKSNKNSKVRKYLPAFVLVASFYYSFLLALGLAFWMSV